MLMVAEMTGSLSILTPAMVAVGLSWLIVRRNDDTIYRSQLKSRADAPAQRILAGLPLLGAIPTTRAMATPRVIISSDMATTTAKRALEDANLNGAPVIDGAKRFTGTLSCSALVSSNANRRSVSDLVDAGAPVVSASSRLDVALESLTEAPLSWVPVLDGDRRVIGTLSISDIVRAYRLELAGTAERMSGLGASAGVSLLTISGDSPMAGKTLRQAALPKGLLITSVTRGDRVFVPNGDTELAQGDELSVLGQPVGSEETGSVELPPRHTPSTSLRRHGHN
jgi:CIC family chloride channel protein